MDLFFSFLSDLSQFVVLDGFTSSSKSINSGVPQGSVLGPTLFLLFINDIHQNLENKLHLYADDATLHCCVPPDSDARHFAESIQRDLNRIEVWANSWCVEFSAAKCEVIVFSRKTSPPTCNLLFFGKVLSSVNNLSLLGLTFTNKLKWNDHIFHFSKKAARCLGMLRRASWLLPAFSLSVLYKAMVRPLLKYASPVW